MVQPFEKALEQIAQNTSVMAEQMPIITDSVKKIYQVENEEKNKEEKKSIEKERVEADPAGGKSDNADVVKGLADVSAQIKSLKSIIVKTNNKQDKENRFSLNPLNWFQQKKQEGGFVYNSPIKKFQKGGGVYTVPGNSTGDKHPMLLPAGSFVLNRNASQFIDSPPSSSNVSPIPIWI